MLNLTQEFLRLILHERKQLYSRQTQDGAYISQGARELTEADLKAHFDGSMTVAAKLLQPGTNLAKAGVIDFDQGAGETLEDVYMRAMVIKVKADELGLHAYLEFSGRRGFHLWIFLETPLPGSTLRSGITNLCRLTGYDPKEVFPSADTITEDGKGEGKAIKLPCGIHKVSGMRSGFLDGDVQWEDGVPVLPEDQKSLLASFQQNKPEQIVLLADLESTASKARVEGSKADFSSLKPDEHPPCIQFLLDNGAPTDVEYNSTNLTLARYCVERGFDHAAAYQLANEVAEATPDTHPTSKGLKERLDNFKSALATVLRCPEDYSWNCGYIRGSKELVEAGGCPGRECEFWTLGKKSNEVGIQATVADKMIEDEVLSFILHDPAQGMLEAFKAQLTAEGFISIEGKDYLPRIVWEAKRNLHGQGLEIVPSLIIAEIEQVHPELAPDAQSYLDKLNSARQCSIETFRHHLARIRGNGVRVKTKQFLLKAVEDVGDRKNQVSTILNDIAGKSRQLIKGSTSEIKPMTELMPELIKGMFSNVGSYIPTNIPWLNNVLNGGFKAGSLHIMAAPPGSGKTTFCASCADFAASQNHLVLYVSYEMSREQLFMYSISRQGRINSKFIEGRKWQDDAFEEKHQLSSSVADACRAYNETIAQNIWVEEAGPEITIPALHGLIAQVRSKAGVDEDTPVLVVLDYLQLISTGDEKIDGGSNETLRVSRVATGLKQLARDTNTAVLAISDITKEAYSGSEKSGSLDMSAMRDSFKIAHAADAIFLLQTQTITVSDSKGTTAIKDQLQLAADRYVNNPAKMRAITKARQNNPLDHDAKAAYARLSVVKNRGGMKAEPLMVYEKAFHRFIPIDLLLEEAEEHDNELAI